MNVRTLLRIGFGAGWLSAGACCSAGIFFDTTPATGAPPGTLGGYVMGAFPADPSAEGTMVSVLTPPPAAPVVGDLQFTDDVEHMKVGSWWDTWSHPYAAGDVYYNWDHDLLMLLPDGTLAFYLYVQPNIKATFEFTIDSGATVATVDVDGDSGASYVGFWTDDPFDPLNFVYVRQTTMDSDGFAVGEFGINVIPEPGATAMLTSIGLLGLLIWRRSRR